MAGNIVHFGTDECRRSLILKSAGYSVDLCTSVVKLALIFKQGSGADAVIVNEIDEGKAKQVITAIRAHSSAPLILFEGPDRHPIPSEFDLIIPPLSSPEQWLQRIAATIERSRALLTQSKLVREQSSLLLSDSAALRQKSASVRERARQERARIDENLKRATSPHEN
jgi:hypothetical protein